MDYGILSTSEVRTGHEGRWMDANVLERSPAGFPRKKFPSTSKTAPTADGCGQRAACGVVESAPDFIDHDVYFVTIVLRVGGGRILDVTRLLARDGLQLQPFHDPCSQRQLKYFPHKGKTREQRETREKRQTTKKRQHGHANDQSNEIVVPETAVHIISLGRVIRSLFEKVATSKAKKRYAQKSGQEKKSERRNSQ